MQLIKEKVIKLKSGSSLTIPPSWRIKSVMNGIQVTASENDFSIYFLELSGNHDTVEKLSEAWQSIQPQFDLKASQESRSPATDAWEKSFQVNYEIPASEMRFVFGIVRIFNEQSYLCLVDAKMTGLSRRAADFNIMLESWKPVGFKPIEINLDQAKDWSETDIQEFEKFFADYMKKFQIPGASIALIRKDGKMIYNNAFGVKQRKTNEPVTIDTPFMIGSTTKPLTTLMMAMLIDQKKLTWETPIIDLLKNFSLADKNLSKKMQIRHTVSASTGMPRQDLNWIFRYKGIKPEERISEMKDMKPTTEFGETFQYSNMLVMVGGYAAASTFAPQMDLENAYLLAMQKLIFDPLGMERTVIKPSSALQLGAALPNAVDFDGKTVSIPLELEEACYSVAPAGAIWSTVLDLSKYLLLEMNNGMLDGKRILSETSLLERRKPGIKMSENSHYGLGLSIAKEQGFNIVGHDGGTMGFSSQLFFLPDKGLGMTILANSAFAHPFFLVVRQKMFELTFSMKSQAEEKAQFWLKEKEALINQKSKSITFELKKMQTIDHLLGDYVSPTLGNASFIKSNGKYTIEFEGWTTQVGLEIDETGKKLLVLTSPPWSGAFKLRIAEYDEKLILDCGQEQHDFYPKRINEKEFAYQR